METNDADKEYAVQLIHAITTSFKKGYVFTTLKDNVPLLTLAEVIDALVRDRSINVYEPDSEHSLLFHSGRVN